MEKTKGRSNQSAGNARTQLRATLDIADADGPINPDDTWLDQLSFEELTHLHATGLAEWASPQPDPPATTSTLSNTKHTTTTEHEGLTQPPTRQVGVAVGIVVAVLGTLFAAHSLRSADANSTTPEQAVRSMLAALDASDLLGAVETLTPSERGVVTDEGVPIVNELQRLGDLAAVDLGKVQGIETHLAPLELTTLTATDTTAVVEVRGKVKVTAARPSLFFGPRILSSERSSTSQPETGIRARIAVRKDDGRWAVSLLDTGVLNALSTDRLSTDPVSAPPHNRIAAIGAPTPEELGSRLAEAIRWHNYRRVIELLAPDEYAALHELGDDALPLMPRYLAELGDSSSSAPDLPEALPPRSEPTRGGARVYLDSSSVQVGTDASLTTFIAVERDGSWYFSPARSALRLVRDRLAATMPDTPSATMDAAEVWLERLESFATPVAAIGFATPSSSTVAPARAG